MSRGDRAMSGGDKSNVSWLIAGKKRTRQLCQKEGIQIRIWMFQARNWTDTVALLNISSRKFVSQPGDVISYMSHAVVGLPNTNQDGLTTISTSGALRPLLELGQFGVCRKQANLQNVIAAFQGLSALICFKIFVYWRGACACVRSQLLPFPPTTVIQESI